MFAWLSCLSRWPFQSDQVGWTESRHWGKLLYTAVVGNLKHVETIKIFLPIPTNSYLVIKPYEGLNGRQGYWSWLMAEVSGNWAGWVGTVTWLKCLLSFLICERPDMSSFDLPYCCRVAWDPHKWSSQSISRKKNAFFFTESPLYFAFWLEPPRS